MSLRIIKAGLFDSIQDTGRAGYQHLGINPGGAMDRYAAQLANALLGQDLAAPVIELHFPAAQILFEEATIICITGADFSAMINDKELCINQPYLIGAGSILKFNKPGKGARSYLAVYNGLPIDKWLNSYSTNIKAAAGGFNGRKLMKNDVIPFQTINLQPPHEMLVALPWREEVEKINKKIEFIKGPEWDWITEESQRNFQTASFTISNTSDRMGYRLTGAALQLKEQAEMISSAVTFGTVQLLPNGQLIVLMADHQTTGGYPRIATVIAADLSILAQKRPNENIQFREITIEKAEEKIISRQQQLLKIQKDCKLGLQNWANG